MGEWFTMQYPGKATTVNHYQCAGIEVYQCIHVLVCQCISVLSKQYISVASNTQEGPLHSLSTGGRKCVVHMHHKRFDATTISQKS